MSFARFIALGGEYHRLSAFTATAATVEVHDAIDGEPVSTVEYDLPETIVLTDPATLIGYVVEPEGFTADLIFAHLRNGPLAGGEVILPVT